MNWAEAMVAKKGKAETKKGKAKVRCSLKTQKKKRNKVAKSMVKIIESSERYKIQKECIKSHNYTNTNDDFNYSFLCHKTTFIECHIYQFNFQPIHLIPYIELF